MATQRSEGRDKFDMTQSVQTWNLFVRLTKWAIALSVITLVLMAIFLTGGNPASGV
ncbi:MAG TPA: aa3-type cytochrome c oxidase subunit IV [Alphaproteobacteria bacterium]